MIQLVQCAAIGVISFAIEAAGHAAMIEPPTRNSQGWSVMGPGCPGGSCLWFTQGAQIGCKNATGTPTSKQIAGSVIMGITCEEHAEPTIPFRDQKLGTYNLKFHATRPSTWIDWTKNNPWRFPGSAPVEDPCGVAGGWYHAGTMGSGGFPPFGIPQGKRGSELPKLMKETVWIAGGVAEVAWAIQANHGGGYQYRVCPVDQALTEECFQLNPLEFVGDKQWLQFGSGMDFDRTNRTEIAATRLSQGTMPAGSTWTKNPVPACGDSFHGGACNEPSFVGKPLECSSSTFPEPLPGVSGFGGTTCLHGHEWDHANPKCRCTLEQFKDKNFKFAVVDQVRVPSTPGDYVLSWRWDNEQTTQVFTNCGDVRVVAEGTAEPTKPFQKYDGCDSCCASSQGVCSNCTKCLNDKTGDCTYCWNPLPGFHPTPYVPQAQCLGHERVDGGPTQWKAGDDVLLWSPGCTKCWKEGACDAAARESVKTGLLV